MSVFSTLGSSLLVALSLLLLPLTPTLPCLFVASCTDLIMPNVSLRNSSLVSTWAHPRHLGYVKFYKFR